MPISDQIRALRRLRGHSLTEVSKRAGISIPTVRSVESGTASMRSMFSVLSLLEAEIDWPQKPKLALGAALAQARRSQCISQRAMASMVEVTQPTIIALEIRNTGRIVTLERFADALRLQITVRPIQEPIIKKTLVPKKNEPIADLIYTPVVLAAKILEALPLSGEVLDPCRGDGAFFDQLPAHVGRHWCEIEEGRNFLVWDRKVDWIVTNPPWSKFRRFLTHGMTVADNVVYLAALTHFSTKARVRDIKSHGFGMRTILYVPTPKEWPSSGFQMAAVWLQRGWDGPCDIKHLGQSK